MVKAPLLLTVEEPLSSFLPLAAAAEEAGSRIGWLEFDELPDSSAKLMAAAAGGFATAVAVGERITWSARPRRGAAVLRDVLRRELPGCDLVLVLGQTVGPLVAPAAEGWSVSSSTRTVELDAKALLGRARRRNPFPELEEGK